MVRSCVPFAPIPRASSVRRSLTPEAAIAHSRYLQLDGAHARVPWPFARAVAVPGSLRRALVPLGAEVFSQLHLHEFLGQDAYSLTQKIGLLHTCLSQHLGECHSQIVG